MGNSEAFLTDGNDVPEERSSTRIRAFLARTRPMIDNEVPDVYWEGRALLESLALSFEVGSDCTWDPSQCATVPRLHELHRANSWQLLLQ